ncbi:thiol-disulfide oxidoreductase DCC family protein [Yersinia ruckeri]|uniref:thiol-disulfide oxidoreductase DCC family protein n=1 Tax=Yersinia ruckeri TaxID=29486 RepID=UPI001F38A9BE|nr:thiol-disulfide oxidoreductase DCC family protein [Yersinia ruckeri]UIN00029.1 thiol-disulfide oxidoreductase DCC family protein [Yersinia ruckeri]
MYSHPPYIKLDDRVVIFDATCKLCISWVNFLICHDRHHTVRLVSVQSEKGKVLFAWSGLSADKINTIVLIDKGSVFLRSEAIFRIMNKLPIPWRWISMFRIFPQSFRDMCYNHIAINRYRLFGRYNTAQTLDADHSQRFLD